MPAAALWRRDSQRLCEGHQRAVLKWLLVRRSEGPGYRASTRQAHRIVQRVAAPPTLPDAAAVAIASLRLAVPPALAGINQLTRLRSEEATSELQSLMHQSD